MLDYTFKVDHPSLFVKMRLGKTLVTIRRCKTYSNCNHFLIIAPYQAFISWEEELLSENQGQLIEVSGKSENRLNIVKENWDSSKWFFASKENNRWAPEVFNEPWDVVIVDESTFIKDPKATVTKYFIKHFRNIKHRWILTGTPDPKSPLDYFTQLRFLNSNILKQYKNYWQFRDKAFKLSNGRSFNYELTKPGNKALTEDLAQNCFFLNREQAGIKVDTVTQPRYLELPPKLLKLYIKAEEEFSLQVSKNKEVLTKWAPVRFQWMEDLCNGFIEDRFVWNGKVKEIIYLLKTELKNEPIIIYSTRVKYLKMLEKELKGFKRKLVYGDTPQTTRREYFKDFQKGKFQILIANPDCVQFSLDFSISSTIFWYNQGTNETRLQADERIFKVGKPGGLLYLDFLVKDSQEDLYYQNRIDVSDSMYMLRLYVKRLKEKYDLK